MEIRHLKSFLILAEELNFGRAAFRLHISQPPLTRQIQQLEEELGAQLFVRNTQGVALTSAGIMLVEEARRMLCMLQSVKRRVKKAGRGQIGYLGIAISGSEAFSYIPQIMHEFKKTHPNVDLVLYEQTKAEQIQALRDHRIGIAFSRDYGVEPDINVEKILTEPLLVAINSKHQFAKEKAISLKEISQEPMIFYANKPRTAFSQKIMALFQEAGVEPNVIQEMVSITTAISLVSCGFGFCVAPQAAKGMELPTISWLPIKDSGATVDLYCLYRRDDESPVLLEFLDLVRKFGANVNLVES